VTPLRTPCPKTSINQYINQPTNQSINQYINQPINISTNQSINQYNNQLISFGLFALQFCLFELNPIPIQRFPDPWQEKESIIKPSPAYCYSAITLGSK